MRKIGLLAAVVAAAMAFANVSSASALSWSPQNTNVAFQSQKLEVQGVFPGYLTDCREGSFWSSKASGAVVGFTNSLSMTCHDFQGIRPNGRLESKGQWSLTATSTSTATLKADTSPSGGTVLAVSLPSGSGTESCLLTVKGPLTISGLPYNNTTKTLTLNNPVAVQKTGWCSPLVGSTVNLKGSFVSFGYTILP